MLLPFLAPSSYLAVSVFCILISIHLSGTSRRLSIPFIALTVPFIAMGLEGFLYAFSGSIPLAEASILAPLYTLAWTAIFSYIIYTISGIGKLKYVALLVLSSSATIMLISGQEWFFLVSFLGYYLGMMSFFVLYVFSDQPVRSGGFFGQVSILLGVVLLLVDSGPFDPLSALPNIFLMASLGYFMRHGLMFSRYIGPSKLDILEKKDDGQYIEVWKPMSYLLSYIILLNIALFVTSIGLHELGHLAGGTLLGCRGQGIVLVNLMDPHTPGPYTLLECPPGVQENSLAFLGLSGFIFLVPLGLFLLVLRRFPERNLSHVVLGLSVMLASIDMLLLLPGSPIAYVTMSLGIVWICIGEVFLVNEYIEHARHRARMRKVEEALVESMGTRGTHAMPAHREEMARLKRILRRLRKDSDVAGQAD